MSLSYLRPTNLQYTQKAFTNWEVFFVFSNKINITDYLQSGSAHLGKQRGPIGKKHLV